MNKSRISLNGAAIGAFFLLVFSLCTNCVGQSGPIVSTPASFAISPPLNSLHVSQSPPSISNIDADFILPNAENPPNLFTPNKDPLAVPQTQTGLGIMPSAWSFDGIQHTGYSPPDPNGDVGPIYYIQSVNMSCAIFDKTNGNLVANTTISSLWPSNSFCGTNPAGDPIVLYDRGADRWMISQMAWTAQDAPPYHQCIAISASYDPTYTWYLYDYIVSNKLMNDYPHFGVWPDAYYMSINQWFFPGGKDTWGGAGAVAFERAKMLSGDATARMVYFNIGSGTGNTCIGSITGDCWEGMLPSHWEGLAPPPSGAPNLFIEWDDSSHIPTRNYDALSIFRFHVDWTNPANSTFGQGIYPDYVLETNNASPFPMSCSGSPCIPQAGTAQHLDSVGDRVMNRFVYRNFGTYESMVTNRTVDVGDGNGNRAGIFWWELRNLSSPSINQQGIYAPTDTIHRWMGSITMDKVGDMAIGFSGASANIHSSILYTGRLSTDPAGTFGQGEATIVAGSGSQIGVSRWGDYTSISIDPVDDCTFWYANEYYSVSIDCGLNGNSPCPWSTRIGRFKYPSCATAPCTAPGAPNLTSAIGACGHTVNLAWTAGTGTTNAYTVYRSDNTSCPVGTLTLLATLPKTQTTYADTTGAGGNTYTYIVRGACDSGGSGESGNSNCIAATPQNTPTAPTNITVTDGPTGLTISWSDNATFHNIYRRDGGCGSNNWVLVCVSFPITWTDTTVVPGTTYGYYIQACNGSNGNICCIGDLNNCVSGTYTGLSISGNVTETDHISGDGTTVKGALNATISYTFNGTIVSKQISDQANGYYKFDNLLPGAYTLSAARGTNAFFPASRTVTLTTSDATGQDFHTNIYVAVFTGRIALSKYPGEISLGGWTITAVSLDYTAATTSDDAGNYTLLLPAGTYQVTAQKSCTTSYPAYLTLTVGNQVGTGLDFLWNGWTACSGCNATNFTDRKTCSGLPLSQQDVCLATATRTFQRCMLTATTDARSLLYNATVLSVQVHRSTGKPQDDLETFTVAEEGDYYINLTNGDLFNQETVVSSAVISMPPFGTLFGPSDFNKNVFQLKNMVHLTPGQYTITTELRSQPGSYITLVISNVDISTLPDLP